MTNETQTKRPTHAVYQVIGEGEKPYWSRIGAGWQHQDGKGINLDMDALPMRGRVVIRVIEDKPK